MWMWLEHRNKSMHELIAWYIEILSHNMVKDHTSDFITLRVNSAGQKMLEYSLSLLRLYWTRGHLLFL